MLSKEWDRISVWEGSFFGGYISRDGFLLGHLRLTERIEVADL